MNRFVFIITFRNNKDYIKECANSLINQNYKNWIAIFGDDDSSDSTVDEIPQDDRFVINVNKKRIGTLMNVHNCIVNSDLKDDDIICILDGDDKLLDNNSINILNNLYNDDETLLTYGQYVTSRGTLGHCRPYSEESFKNLRKLGFWASHMRTFKYKLYKEFLRQDPNLDYYKDENGNWYMAACDVAKITPLMEIAGFNKIKFNPIPIYYYRIHENNHKSVDLQKKSADHAFSKKPLIEGLFINI
jgi:glycosyltransferase involved in cell wall biosynthesis